MQTENWSLKKIIDRPITKWIIIPASVLIMLGSCFFWGLNSRYDFQENDKNQVFCTLVFDCSPNQSPIDAHPGEGNVVIEPINNSEGARVKPLTGAIVVGGVTTVTATALTAIGVIAFPAEMILLAGAAIASGTYIVFKGF